MNNNRKTTTNNNYEISSKQPSKGKPSTPPTSPAMGTSGNTSRR